MSHHWWVELSRETKKLAGPVIMLNIKKKSKM